MLEVGPHQNAVELRDVLEDEKEVHLVIDYYEKGDLFEHLAKRGRVGETEAAVIIRSATSHSDTLLTSDIQRLPLSQCLMSAHPVCGLMLHSRSLGRRSYLPTRAGLAICFFPLYPSFVHSRHTAESVTGG